MDWRIYYDDYSTFDSTQGTPPEAPCLGVICVLYAHEDCGRYVMSMHDFYWYDGKDWLGGDHFGLWDYLSTPGYKTVKFGRSVPGERYKEILRIANNDPDFPRRSGWSRGETKV